MKRVRRRRHLLALHALLLQCGTACVRTRTRGLLLEVSGGQIPHLSSARLLISTFAAEWVCAQATNTLYLLRVAFQPSVVTMRQPLMSSASVLSILLFVLDPDSSSSLVGAFSTDGSKSLGGWGRNPTEMSSAHNAELPRRRLVVGSFAAAASLLLQPSISHANTDTANAIASASANANTEAFRTGAFGREEYTNSIVASRDTNISPKEVYDSIESQYVKYPLEKLREQQKQHHAGAGATQQRQPRALDVGAGAGVSTQVLWDMGYREIDAVDWSGKAWERFVIDDPSASCPESVKFYELDDERYIDEWRSQGSHRFDAITFNFGINERKAISFARDLLEPENGRLLAPVNVQTDYWLKQVYKVYDSKGDVVNVLGQDIGAWAVQFQPDVTQNTCQGIWCAEFNGFQRKR